MKVLADMHVAPPLRRWMTRLGLAIVVAIAIGYLPSELLRRDPRAMKLEHELAERQQESRELEASNHALYRQVEALRNDVNAVEDRARADLGMVYPDEIVIRVRREQDATLAAPAPKPVGETP